MDPLQMVILSYTLCPSAKKIEGSSSRDVLFFHGLNEVTTCRVTSRSCLHDSCGSMKTQSTATFQTIYLKLNLFIRVIYTSIVTPTLFYSRLSMQCKVTIQIKFHGTLVFILAPANFMCCVGLMIHLLSLYFTHKHSSSHVILVHCLGQTITFLLLLISFKPPHNF